MIFVYIFMSIVQITFGQQSATVVFSTTSEWQTSGSVQLTNTDNGVHIKGHVTGLTPGLHGFHIHATGNLGSNCLDAGGHFNPLQKIHGGPSDVERHAGDLGNILAETSGTAVVDILDNNISLDRRSDLFIGGLAIVIHAKADDLGRGGNEGSLSTGNAGARVGCGRINMDIAQEQKQTFQQQTFQQQNAGISVPVAPEFVDPNTFQGQQILATHDVYKAIVDIVPGVNKTSGQLTVMSNKGGVMITGKIFGLSPGFHGFHVHQNGQTGNTCVDAGGHFNPFKRNHGSPESQNRHVGDLGNIEADKFGIANIEIFDDHASLDPLSPAYIGGRAFVVHAAPDDLGRGQDEGSKKTGNAGARAGCGIIQVVPDENSEVPRNDQLQSGFEFTGASAKVDVLPGGSEAGGTLEINEEINGVRITGTLTGLTPGLHGFHVHQKGLLSNKCVDAGGHFNPFQRTHGDPKSRERHVGDLGNVLADNQGVAHINILDDHISLDSQQPAFIGGKAIVVHAGADDLGRGRNEESSRTGNAGSRAACGVIQMNEPKSGNLQVANRKIIFPIHKRPVRTVSNHPNLPFQQRGGQSAIQFGNLVANAIVVPGNSKTINGRLSLYEHPQGVLISGRVGGLTPGGHGFHVHQSGLLGNSCVEAQGHFNPFERMHGDPQSTERHVGDLGNIIADPDGIAQVNILDNHISMDPSNPAYIGGRAFVIHENPDDLGRGPNEDSRRTGNAGPRAGCARINVIGDKLQQRIPLPSDTSVQTFLDQVTHAQVQIIPAGDSGVRGYLELIREPKGVSVRGQVVGLSPGLHGFHVHQEGKLGNKCVDAGGHFNPFERKHGSPKDAQRHVGDLGNIEADIKGVANIDFFDHHISLDPKTTNYIGGRAFVIHAKADDLGRGGNEDSTKTGNAGPRVACGLIIDISQQPSVSQPVDINSQLTRPQTFSQPQKTNFNQRHFGSPHNQNFQSSIHRVTPIPPNNNERPRPSNSNSHQNFNPRPHPSHSTPLQHSNPNLHHRNPIPLQQNIPNNHHGNPFPIQENSRRPFHNVNSRPLGHRNQIPHTGASIPLQHNSHRPPHFETRLPHSNDQRIHPNLPRQPIHHQQRTNSFRPPHGVNLDSRPSVSSFHQQSFGHFPSRHNQFQQSRQQRIVDHRLQASHSVQNPSFPGRRQQRNVVEFVPGKDPKLRGSLDITEASNGVQMKGRIEGLSPGLHGFHVHQNGNLTNNCDDAGPHFNPLDRNHGSPDVYDRHAGDLGNIMADKKGVALVDITDNHISLNPKSQTFIVGRALVVHELPDDLGRGGDDGSRRTGNAGSRLGCAIIEMPRRQTLHPLPDPPTTSNKNPLDYPRNDKRNFFSK